MPIHGFDILRFQWPGLVFAACSWFGVWDSLVESIRNLVKAAAWEEEIFSVCLCSLWKWYPWKWKQRQRPWIWGVKTKWFVGEDFVYWVGGVCTPSHKFVSAQKQLTPYCSAWTCDWYRSATLLGEWPGFQVAGRRHQYLVALSHVSLLAILIILIVMVSSIYGPFPICSVLFWARYGQ